MNTYAHRLTPKVREEKRTTLPDIQKIVAQRIKAGIAGLDEREMFLKGELVDQDYTHEFKQRLLDELVEELKKTSKQ